jgi:hypothetical protein
MKYDRPHSAETEEPTSAAELHIVLVPVEGGESARWSGRRPGLFRRMWVQAARHLRTDTDKAPGTTNGHSS